MSDRLSWLLYGANGFTGRWIAEEAVRRGHRAVLAGRNRQRIEELAGQLHCPARAFDLKEPARIAAQLTGTRAVLNCAGPFSRTAAPLIEACLAAGVHYLDITGEIDVIAAAAERHGDAVRAGVAVIPAVGFDVVPSDCLAAMLHRRLPDATRLELAFAGTGAISPGTAQTMLENLPRGGRVRIDGRIVPVPAAWKTKTVPFREGPRSTVTIPWGDVASAYLSTGVPNIEVYMAMPEVQIRWLRRFRPLLPLLRLPLPESLVRGVLRRFMLGPTSRPAGELRGSFWVQMANDRGETVQATLTTPGGYQLTVQTALASLERVLGGQVTPGFATPSRAFGDDFILSIPDTDFRWEPQGEI